MTRDESWRLLQASMPLASVFSGTEMVLIRHVHDAAFENGGMAGADNTVAIYRKIREHSDALAKAMVG